MSETKTLKQKYSSLPKRIFTSVIFLSLLSASIYFDQNQFNMPICLSFMLVMIGGLVTFEFYDMAMKIQHRPFRFIGCFISILLLAELPLQRIFLHNDIQIALPNQITIITFGVMLTFLEQGRQKDASMIYANSGITICGFLYIGLLGSYLLKIAWQSDHLPIGINGIHLLCIAVLVIKMTDIGGFLIGAAIGKHKWIPRISPGKSIEGLLGGMFSATALAWILGVWVWPVFNSYYEVIFFGLVLSFFGQLADLAESMFKRAANVKDSGTLLPGFGGFFDLTDSLIAGAPVAYLLYSLIL